MRLASFRDDVVYGMAHLLGVTPGTTDFSPERFTQWCAAINDWVRKGWKAFDFPELTVTEERAFRTIWNSTKQFKRSSTTDANRMGKVDQLLYIPDFTYYQVKAAAVTDPPVGTLPTNTTYFEPITTTGADATFFDKYVDLDQSCRRAIGTVRGVYGSDPRNTGYPALNHRISEKGIDVPWAGGNSVYVWFTIRHSVFTSVAWSAATAYRKGGLALWTDGNCYRALEPNTNITPMNSGTWVLVPFPERLSQFVKCGAAADVADDLQTSQKLLMQAQGYIEGEIDDLIAQGNVVYYNLFPRLVSVLLPLGTSSFLWSVTAPWGGTTSETTTLTDECEDEGGGSVIITINAEPGETALVQDQDYIDIVFATTKVDAAGDPTTEWSFDSFDIEYPTPPPPEKIYRADSIIKSSTGARVYLNAGPSDGLFVARWRVA